ncbi:putative iSSfl4 ORF3 [Escherichia coli 3-267-03_S4_C2]|nr:putative iSSfl4 ORF3 [Escherichia coli 2-011-08_S1_C1]KDU22652.1 putative iSSfl4 ORF3 [Escherichia coli 3-267-03_S4_C2]KDX87403.1 putative iSSfl4 ORF3 [Escherichia coli 2-222-05_S4_C2]KEL79655.1 putative iSSfl4 ORF3 [Escherichia coli 5-366-08_S3_C2]KEO08303.1 putative iSSfl4 ORF3 [Escherichia coli 2-222-05_S4_C3]
MNNELPDDIGLLKAMLRTQQSRLRQYACQVAGYEQEIERLKAQLDRLSSNVVRPELREKAS